MDKEVKIPAPTIERLALYSRPLEKLLDEGSLVVSSDKLAALCGVNSAQIRKDLAYFGEFGVRGVGYEVKELLRHIKKILSTDRDWKLCIFGVGNLGSALLENDNFRKRRYRFVAAFDSDPGKIGKRLHSGLVILPLADAEEVVSRLGIEIGVIATTPTEAQRAADILMNAGVKAILNFSPIQLRSLECCIVENVDFSLNLENLAYHLAKTR